MKTLVRLTVLVGVVLIALFVSTPLAHAGEIESWNGNGGSIPSFSFMPVTQSSVPENDVDEPEIVIHVIPDGPVQPTCGEYHTDGPHPCPGGRNDNDSSGIGIPVPDPKRLQTNK
jgi:hypothetical protein